MLDLIKEEDGSPSFDQVVADLAQSRLHLPSSMAGAIKGMRWKKTDRMETREL